MSGDLTGDGAGDSAEWLRRLLDERRPGHRTAVAQMHDFLVRAARRELYRGSTAFTTKEIDDLADQVAADSLLAVLAKLPAFRGESKLTTWAYGFVVLELSNRLRCRRRHTWGPSLELDHQDWDPVFADHPNHNPCRHAEAQEMMAAVGRAFTAVLTEQQRRVFIETVIDGVPPTAVADKYGMSRNTLYKNIFDSRRKIRSFLTAHGFEVDGSALTG
jgi:RNA polymerase sigma-70 factor, ECF subfamily